MWGRNTPFGGVQSTHVKPGQKLKLSRIPTDTLGPFKNKHDPAVEKRLHKDAKELCQLQELLYAEQRRSVLVVLQAMDTGGKDGLLRHVVGPLDSRGVEVVSVKAQTETELAHDFLWRVHAHTPRKGQMTFFNRSHYEDVLAVRVMKLQPEEIWRQRFDHIAAFERLLSDEGTRVVKFFLHISRDEQRRRLKERLRDPAKHWKLSPEDLVARAEWKEYESAYEEALSRTSTDQSPWYIVPADRKWVRDVAVTRVLVDLLREMNPQPPKIKIDPKKFKIPT